MDKHPPPLAQRLLLRFLREDLAEEVQGDLEEKFYVTIKNKSVFRAKLNYWYQVLNYLRPFARRKSRSHTLFHFAMLQSYFRIGWRNLLKNKGYSFINIGGLATGMTIAILVGLWVHDELSFNTSHKNYDRIAQVYKGSSSSGVLWKSGQKWLPYPLVSELKASYSGSFKHIVTAAEAHEYILTAGETMVSKTGQYIEHNAPEMFSFEMTYGTWAGLKDPYSIMVSATAAESLFGKTDPLDRVVKLNNELDLKVTGVYKDFPQNSHLYGTDFFLPWDLYVSRNTWIAEQGWDNHFVFIYAEIQPDRNFETVNNYIKDAELKKIGNLDYMKEELKDRPQIFLLPMCDWHLRSSFKNGSTDPGPIDFVWLISIIGGCVLLLACINFMNLSTARSEKRAREVGIRKTMGSMRTQLISQFFSESFLVVTLAFGVAVMFTYAALPWFNDIAAKKIEMPWRNQWFWMTCMSFILLTGFLAGSYPALYLSSFNPVKVLKGTFRAGRFAAVPRKILVVVQFSVSASLIIATIIVYNQIVYAQNRPVGYTREGLLLIQKKSAAFNDKHEALRNALMNTGMVIEMAESGGPVTNIWSNGGGFTWNDKELGKETGFGTLSITPEYGKTVGWKFLHGRDFSTEFSSDSSRIIINEAAAKLMGLSDAVGETVHWKSKWHSVDDDFKILGVIEDMVMRSPYDRINPSVFYIHRSGWLNWINIRLKPDVSAKDALPKIEAVFKKIVPTVPFNYKFADAEYAIKFATEERIAKLASAFAALAIFISCLGLFGLASFTAEQRTKESRYSQSCWRFHF
jgi:putative ABC transport system permease protein